MLALVDNWWAFVVRGIFAILFGIAALAYPGMTLLLLVVFFGAYAVVDGAVSLVSAFGNEDWLWYTLGGLVSIAAGLFAFTRPAITGLALAILIGIWAIAKGVVEVATAWRIRKQIEGEFFLILAGAVSILFGLFVVARPGAGAMAIIWVIAFYAIVFGALSLALGAKLRGIKKSMEGGATPTAA